MTATTGTAGMPTLNQDVLVEIIPFLSSHDALAVGRRVEICGRGGQVQQLHAERLALVASLPAEIDFNDKPGLVGSAVA
ncbi:hypothetical protein NUW54_g5909 [Trametes sanguinea]|uniref:Uncharacterized protein n=1 Tax=Trametes sanguinea TaxID=158606 RepID=A0ACC1PVN0_9APHY|nr:hypothetical protein NUW54_g5909 [Trametes sanguinea]